MVRRSWDEESVLELDSGRVRQGKFAVWDDAEYMFAFIYHRNSGGISSCGTVKLSLAQEALPASADNIALAAPHAHVPLPVATATSLWQKLMQVADTGRSLRDAEGAFQELCRQGKVRIDDAGDALSSDMATRTGDLVLMVLRVAQGLYELSLERQNAWYNGYQTASVLVTRRGWDHKLACQLDSGRSNRLKFAVMNDFEYLCVLVAHHCTGGGSASGVARLALSRVDELPVHERFCEPLDRGSLTLTRAVFRSGASLASKALRPGRLAMDADAASALDATVREARVFLASDRQLQMVGHWVAIFQFGPEDLCVCEENAVDADGIRFGAVDWVFRVVESSLECYLEQDGGVLRCCHLIEHERISVHTSKAELLHRCRTNPMNYTQYDINSNNCQLWVKLLLVNGLGVDQALLPRRWGEVNGTLAVSAGALATGIAAATFAPAAGLVCGLSAASLGAAVVSGRTERREQ
eukprot:TRINITY_DN63489_c0_g1_i1.p1 TRINITY_DN63489_c0_g1~~TRINITY_DN63489_c0_g1_i1.p1  ORF type:complete len:468 (-),score=101.22 TRINITY_DN63489_c0_g1_i1:339-1742(-)